MIKIYLLRLSIPATTNSELFMGELVVPDGKAWTFTELRPTLVTGGALFVYVQNERVCTFIAGINADVQFRAANWELKSGEVIRLSGTNSTGGAILQGVEFVLDEK